LFGISKFTILRLMIVSFGLALYEMFFKSKYIAWLEQNGEKGIGEVAFGYFMVLVLSYIFAWIIIRRGSD